MTVVTNVPHEARSDLGLAALWFAKADLEAGVREDLGRNDGTRIRQYAEAFGLTPPINWCAVTFSAWLRNGSLLSDIDMPIAGSGKKARVDVLAAAEWIRRHGPSAAFVERGQAMPRQGSSSGFLYGRSVGAIEAAVALCHVPVSVVEPSVWKRRLNRRDCSRCKSFHSNTRCSRVSVIMVEPRPH